MTEQEQKLTSVKYLLDIIDDLLCDKSDFDFFLYNQICVEAWEKYEKEVDEIYKEAFEKGYEEGVKYTDGLIKDERFPF